MQMPKWTAGLPLPGMGGALALSALSHALVVAGWLYWRHHTGPEASVGQQRGGLTVHLQALPTDTRQAGPSQGDKPMTVAANIPPTPAQQRPTGHREPTNPLLTPEPRPSDTPLHPSATETAPPLAQAVASEAQGAAIPATQVASQAGATFASMFAPIISRPVGHGRWTSARPAIPTPLDLDAQRQQAMDSVRRQLLERLDLLAGQLPSQPLSGTCSVQISLETQTGQLTCDHEADQPRIWQALTGLVRSAALSANRSNFCFHIALQQVTREGCDATTSPGQQAGATP